MPKPIKKRIIKKTEPEKEIKSTFVRLQEGFKERGQDLKRILIISAVALVLISGFIIYSLYSKSRASRLFYEGYRAFYVERVIPAGGYMKALEALKKSYDSRPDPLTLLYIADGYQKMGSLDEALKILEEFKKKYNDNRYLMPLCYQRMAMIYKKKGLNEEALRVYEELYRNGYTLKDLALYESARILSESKRTEEAKNKMEQLKKEFPQSPYLGMLKSEK